ncbi:MAG: maltodextrin glucosidase [Anaerolineae bacterium]|nr:maltodextrin glucosidase [Anaerolineae bacterium]
MRANLHWTAGLHHDGSSLYVSNLAPQIGDRVTLKLRAPADAPIDRVLLRTAPDGENHLELMHEAHRDDHLVWYEVEMPIPMPSNPYRFKVITREGAYFLTQAGVSRADSPEWTDFKLLANYASPRWANSSVFYQIFPDRFYNGDPATTIPAGAWTKRNHSTQVRQWGELPLTWKESGSLDYYGGDLQGIAQKVPYLLDLGVNAIYLNPIFVAYSNHRYDIADFFKVDPYVGGDEGLIQLRETLDQHDMKMMLDVTLNHAGWQHPWFVEAQQNAESPTNEYFTFYEHPNRYEMWLGVPSLVKLNYRSEKLRDVMYRGQDSVLRKWMRAPFRIDGWRLDVANMQARQGSIQLAHKIGRGIRKAVKEESPEAYLIGEHFYDATTYLQGDELDATMNYSGFAIPLWRWLSGHDLGMDWRPEMADPTLMRGEDLAAQWTRFRSPLPWQVARHQYNLLDSHDTSRLLHKVHGDKSLLYLAAAILMTYPGTPSVYYGTEIGMTGAQDPDNRRTMPWDEHEWDHDLLKYFKQIIHLRRSAPALIDGGFQHLFAEDGLMVYQRQSSGQRLIVVGYRGPDTLLEHAIPVWHSGIHDGATLVDLLGGESYRVDGGLIAVRGLDKGAVLILEER